MKKLILLSLLWIAGICLLPAQGLKFTEEPLNLNSFENPNNINPDDEIKTEKKFSFNGYYNITEIGFLAGSTNNINPAPFSFITINGWHITEKIATGIGIGAEFNAESYMPVVLDARYYLRDKSFSPFFFVQAGYSIGLDDEADEQIIYNHWHIWPDIEWGRPSNIKVKGGAIFNPGFGIRKLVNENLGYILTVGYRIQQLNYERDENSKLAVSYNRLVIKIAITFR